MADVMQFELVSPERLLTSVKASTVQIPGADGDMTAMPNHAPTITTIRPGIVRVSGPEGDAEYVVTGGFAEISPETTSILAEHALPVAEVTQEVIDKLITTAASATDNATNEKLDMLAKQASDLAAVAAELGLKGN
ncbi:MAG: ATP synthase F1 subunit epsilon [Rhodobacterales bacterium]|nr:MAG: ATP synthase F1 subunit epsilon [Rhodobacterales bacterium]